MDRQSVGKQRQSRIVVIPEIILQDKRFTPSAKLVYARIAFFDEFWESSEETAEYLGLTKRSVQEAKRTLEYYGAIIETRNTGRGKRYMACTKIGELLLKEDLSEDDVSRLKKLSEICLARSRRQKPEKAKSSKNWKSELQTGESSKKCNSEFQKLEVTVPKNGDIDKNIGKNNNKTISKDIEGNSTLISEKTLIKRITKVDNRNPDIKKCMEAWEEAFGKKLTTKPTLGNFACKRLIGKYGIKQVLLALPYAAKAREQEYAPQIYNFKDLEDKWERLGAWIQRQSLKQDSDGVAKVSVADDMTPPSSADPPHSNQSLPELQIGSFFE